MNRNLNEKWHLYAVVPNEKSVIEGRVAIAVASLVRENLAEQIGLTMVRSRQDLQTLQQANAVPGVDVKAYRPHVYEW